MTLVLYSALAAFSVAFALAIGGAVFGWLRRPRRQLSDNLFQLAEPSRPAVWPSLELPSSGAQGATGRMYAGLARFFPTRNARP